MDNRSREKPIPEPGQSWGVFGGAFDPIHIGHLNLAGEILELRHLSGVFFVPSIKPPHRADAMVSFYHRLSMVELAVSSEPKCLSCSIERDAELSGYALDTLRALNLKFPRVEWHLVVGADQGESFHTWHKPDEILKEARLIVGARPGHKPCLPKLKDTSSIEIIPIPLVDLSSTEIRSRIAEGIAESELSRLVTPAVAAYIITHRLYQP